MRFLTQTIEWTKAHQMHALLLLIAGFILSSTSSLSLNYINSLDIANSYNTKSHLVILLGVLKQSLILAPLQTTCISVVIALMSAFFASMPKDAKIKPKCVLLAILFAFFMIIGGHFSQANVCFDSYQAIKLGMVFISDSLIFYLVLVLIAFGIRNGCLVKLASGDAKPKSAVMRFVFCDHPFGSAFLIILIAWLPYYIFCYPGTTDPNDVLDQLQQFNGIYSRTAAWVNFNDDSWLYVNNNNPFFSTLITNTFINFGSFVFGSQNVGMFALVLAQSFILISGFAYLNKMQIELGTPYFLRTLFLVFTAFFMPILPGYAICITKDTLFSGCVLWFVICLIAIRIRNSETKSGASFYVVLILSAALMCLIRNNGIYMLLLTLAVLFLCKGFRTRFASIVLCVVAVAYFIYGSALLPSLGVASGSVKEMLSAPFQQTARYVVQHPNEVSDSQEEAISKVLDYENLSNLYNPSLSDGVKETFNKDASGEDLVNYFIAWGEMGLKHPGTYASATFANCYAYFYPGVNTGWIWTCLNCYGANESIDITQSYLESGFDLSQNQDTRDIRLALREWFDVVANSSLGIFSNMGFAAWIVIALFVFLFNRRDVGAVLPFIPAIVLLLVCILSPQNGNPRYALPLIVCIWPMLLYGWWAICQMNLSQVIHKGTKYED